MERPTADDPLPVIVDTDTASDDAQALAYAARSPRLDLQAVTVVAGNVAFDDQVANALHTLELVGSDAPVYRGARRPLAKDHEPATEVHGPTGLGRLRATPSREPADGYAVDELLARVRANPGELGVIGIGPATNIAEAIRREPRFGELVRGVWLMGGAIDCRGNVTPAAEFNAWVDPDAARLVFREVDTTLVDWGLSRQAALGPATLDRIDDLDTELAAFFRDATATARERADDRGDGRIAQPDALAVAAAARPELIRATTDYRIAVDDRAGLTRGETVAFDPEAEDVGDERPTGDAVTRVIDRVDTETFRESLVSLLADGTPAVEA